MLPRATTDCVAARYYQVLMGGAHGNLDLLELIDGRSYTSQCGSASRTREAAKRMGECVLTHPS